MADMRMIGEYEVVVNTEDYLTLVEDQHSYFILVDALIKKANLSWNKKFLSFSDEDVSLILSLLSPYKYEIKLAELQKEQEEADGTDND